MARKSARGNILLGKLLARGVRLTKQRKLILGLIEEAGEHVDASRIQELAAAEGAAVDRATVYRTLALLKKHGLISELDFLHVRGDQHWYEASGKTGHVHACCERCGAVTELSSRTLDALMEETRAALGFEPKSVRVEIGGCCSKCAR